MNATTSNTMNNNSMIQHTLTVRFNTPAFLGNAEQNGQWHTPPFKHLLREWWRVAYAEREHFDIDQTVMCCEEARIFGAAPDTTGSKTGSKSRVRLRLKHWNAGKARQWKHDPKTHHPEVGEQGMNIGSHLYLGYGPLCYKHSTGTRLKANAAIQADEQAELKLAFPCNEAALLNRAVTLINAFGTIGSRARNGWGSLDIDASCSANDSTDETLPLRPWQDCLKVEWAHAIGRDEQGVLVWRTETLDDWSTLMQQLAKIKIELRTKQFPFHSGKKAPPPEDRHWLSYPVTNHDVTTWEKKARLSNTLHFKIRRDDKGRLYAIIFHMPCLPPSRFKPDLDQITRVWQRVHAFLDSEKSLQRSA